jgi:hypothetical protein
MNCGEFEILLADYLDGTLGSSESAALERHAASCAGCGELLKDASSAAAFLKRVGEVMPPPELITRIAFQAPIGRTREPFERPGVFSRLAAKWLQPILQPRLAMGMAMTILSFAMLERCTGVRVQHIEAADLNPVRIWGGVEDKAMRFRDRAVKYYENLRWVYEIETRLDALQTQEQAQPQPAPQKDAGHPPKGNQK